MIDPADVPEVQKEEMLARYILHSKYIRSSDNTLKCDAFVPHPYNALSVTRHLHATDDGIWAMGESVARKQDKTFYGRGDLQVKVCIDAHPDIAVTAAPIDDNPNHADIAGWPNDKGEQRLIAKKIAAFAKFVAPG